MNKEIDLSTLSTEELKKLRKEINQCLTSTDKGVFSTKKRLYNNFYYRTDLKHDDRQVYIEAYNTIGEHLVPSIFTILDITLGNYYCSGVRQKYKTPIIKREQKVMVNKELYQGMKDELIELILKYNDKALNNGKENQNE